MDLHHRQQAFVQLGALLRAAAGREKMSGLQDALQRKYDKLLELVSGLERYNGWFTEDNVRRMLGALGESLEAERLQRWLEPYREALETERSPRTVAVVMAGNIPAVGFHDLLTVLISGNKLLAKLSSDDDKLLPAITDLLVELEPRFAGRLAFTDGTIRDFDAVIATGSNNSARYFQYYFAKYPHIIRSNRNGVAVLQGDETREQLEGLADDIFSYYGLGCRNVSKLFVPEGYDFQPLLQVLAGRSDVAENHKYFNNYEYNKAIFLVNSTPHLDSGNLLVVEEERIASPVSVLHYEFYKDRQALQNRLLLLTQNIQCVVSGTPGEKGHVPFGRSQHPELWDYADGVDTLKFVLEL